MEIKIDAINIDICKEMTQILSELTKSYEYYVYNETNKPSEEYDGYDVLVGDAWKRLGAFVEKYNKKEEN